MEIPEEIAPALKKALYRLSMGDLTVGEMKAYLSDPRRKSTGFSEEIAERCTALLVQEGYLDDLRYLKLCLRRLDGKHLGPRRIKQELTKRLFEKKYVDAAMNRSIDYKERARLALNERERVKPRPINPAENKKRTDYLVRLGFDYTTAGDAVSLLVGEDFYD